MLEKSWDVKTRRKWLSKLASDRGLDPLSPPSWYKLASERIKDSKVFKINLFVFIIVFLIVNQLFRQEPLWVIMEGS